MKTPFSKLISMFPGIRSADHLSHEWDVDGYRLDDEDLSPGMNRYPAMLVDSSANVALAEWNWVSMPCFTLGCAGNHAYMLSTRRI